MTVSAVQQIIELLCGFLMGAALVFLELPFRLMRRALPRLGLCWDILFYLFAGFLAFAAGQWCGGVRLRFIVCALLGAALCGGLLAPLRRKAVRKMEQAAKRAGERKAQKGKEPRREKKMKKIEKKPMQNQIFRLK